jgi:hypothetical protein
MSSAPPPGQETDAGSRHSRHPETNKSLLLLFFRKEEPSFLKERSKEL